MSGKYGRKYAKDEDFEEGEVWGLMEDKRDFTARKPIKDSSFFTTSSPSPRNFTAPRMIPKSTSSEIITSGGFNKQSSAPLDIPDWSKIYGKTSNINNNNNNNNDDDGCYYNNNNNGIMDDQQHYYSNGYNNGCNNVHHDDDDSENDDDIDGIIPPHEYLARKFARNQISSFSVYEGIGRTLKGRDLSKVRNTILSKTGFLE